MTPTEIRAIRTRLGLTQAEFAPLLGYKHGNRVVEIEMGRRNPSGAVLLLLRQYDDGIVLPDWLGGHQPDPS
jgi:DNA-binding transcriptional regulator YiaG